MSDKATIRNALQNLAGNRGDSKVQVVLATVTAVNEAERTCTVTTISGLGEITFDNVQLMASVDDGLLLVPTIDSTVIVSYNTFNQPYICLFSGIDKVLLVAGENNASIQVDADGLLLEINETKVLISDGEIKLNDGAYGGLVKVIDLTTKLNNLENKVNAIIAAFNNHTHILTLSTGTGTAAPTAAPVSGTLTPTQRADIENTTVKQG